MRATEPGHTTGPAKCPACGDEVFVRVDPEGRTLLLDELGPTGRIHPCARKVDRSQSAADRQTTESNNEATRTVPGPTGDIQRFDQKAIQPGLLERRGHVRNVLPARSLTTFASPGTLEYESLYRAVANAQFTQFTLIDDDRVSYPLWVVASSRCIREGIYIKVRFRAHEVFGRRFFVVETLDPVPRITGC